MVAYLCPPEDPIAETLRQRAIECECELVIFPDRGPLDIRLVPRIAKLCRENRIDVLQTHDYKSNALGLLVRRLHRCHLATMLHGWTDMSGRMPLYKRIDQWCLPFYETLICVSDDLVEVCRRLRIPDAKIHLIHNAIDTQRFHRTLTVSQAKDQMAARPGRFLIGSVGRLSPEKCFAELIDLVVKLQDLGHPIDLWIAGDGPQRGLLEKRIVDLGRQDSIRLLGQLKDIQVLYQAMDLFVLNSIREGLPNVILEALAFKVPVIATRIAGIPRLVRHQENGLLVAPTNVDELTVAILAMLSDAALRERYAQVGREVIEREFSFDQRMLKIARIYDELLGRSIAPLELPPSAS